MNIGFPIDWAATGQMLIGFATLAGAAAVAYAAYKGAETFNQWKIQKTETRRIELAEEILTTAYEFQRNLDSARSPLSYEMETTKAKNDLILSDERFEYKNTDQKKLLCQGRITLNRISDRKDKFNKLIILMPSAKAIFDDEVFDELKKLYKCVKTLEISASMLGMQGQTDLDFRKKLERDIWKIDDPEDKISLETAESINKLNEILIPVIRDI